MPERPLSRRSSPENVDDERNQGEDQQEVNERSGDVESRPTNDPDRRENKEQKQKDEVGQGAHGSSTPQNVAAREVPKGSYPVNSASREVKSRGCE
jgi:hypothetical protein